MKSLTKTLNETLENTCNWRLIDTLGLSILLYFSKRIVHIKEAAPGGK